jgi:hypothetical protein
MYDPFSDGYLGFALGPDGRTTHYLTGGPVYTLSRVTENGTTRTDLLASPGPFTSR